MRSPGPSVGKLKGGLVQQIAERIATGPREGQKVFTLQTLPVEPDTPRPEVAESSGFSLHAGSQRAQQRLLDGEALERPLAGGAVNAFTGLDQDPFPRLGVEIGEIAEPARRQEVALHVLHARLDDALLGRIGRGHGSMRKP